MQTAQENKWQMDQVAALLQDREGTAESQLYATAYAQYNNGHFNDAARAFLVLTLTKADNPHYWMGLGATYQMLKKYHDALSSYAIAGGLNSENPYVHYHAAECLFSIKEKKQGLSALTSAESAAHNKPEYRELLLRIAVLRELWNNKD